MWRPEGLWVCTHAEGVMWVNMQNDLAPLYISYSHLPLVQVLHSGLVDLITGDDWYAPTDDPISVTVICAQGQDWGIQTTVNDMKRSSTTRLVSRNAHCVPSTIYVNKPGDNAWQFAKVLLQMPILGNA